MGRKTIDVQTIVDYANIQLKRTDEVATMEFKQGICAMVDKTLHSTNNYEGFYHLNPSDCKFNTVGYFSRHYFYNKK